MENLARFRPDWRSHFGDTLENAAPGTGAHSGAGTTRQAQLVLGGVEHGVPVADRKAQAPQAGVRQQLPRQHGLRPSLRMGLEFGPLSSCRSLDPRPHARVHAQSNAYWH